MFCLLGRHAEAGHGAAKLDDVIHRCVFNRFGTEKGKGKLNVVILRPPSTRVEMTTSDTQLSGRRFG